MFIPLVYGHPNFTQSTPSPRTFLRCHSLLLSPHVESDTKTLEGTTPTDRYGDGTIHGYVRGKAPSLLRLILQ
jgi:hypothetical protein